jgi:hypothetical protein
VLDLTILTCFGLVCRTVLWFRHYRHCTCGLQKIKEIYNLGYNICSLLKVNCYFGGTARPQSSGLKSQPSKKQARSRQQASQQLAVCFTLVSPAAPVRCTLITSDKIWGLLSKLRWFLQSYLSVWLVVLFAPRPTNHSTWSLQMSHMPLLVICSWSQTSESSWKCHFKSPEDIQSNMTLLTWLSAVCLDVQIHCSVCIARRQYFAITCTKH